MSKTNHVRLIGHAGQKPKLINLENQQSIISMSVATNESFKDANGVKQTKTDWHNVVAFGKVATLINQYVNKGDHIMIEGKLQTRQFITKDGEQRYTTEVICQDVLFLGSKNSEIQQQ